MRYLEFHKRALELRKEHAAREPPPAQAAAAAEAAAVSTSLPATHKQERDVIPPRRSTTSQTFHANEVLRTPAACARGGASPSGSGRALVATMSHPKDLLAVDLMLDHQMRMLTGGRTQADVLVIDMHSHGAATEPSQQQAHQAALSSLSLIHI